MAECGWRPKWADPDERPASCWDAWNSFWPQVQSILRNTSKPLAWLAIEKEDDIPGLQKAYLLLLQRKVNMAASSFTITITTTITMRKESFKDYIAFLLWLEKRVKLAVPDFNNNNNNNNRLAGLLWKVKSWQPVLGFTIRPNQLSASISIQLFNESFPK